MADRFIPKYRKYELQKATRKELQMLMTNFGIDYENREKKNTYIERILKEQ